jgi:hypothetical protein
MSGPNAEAGVRRQQVKSLGHTTVNLSIGKSFSEKASLSVTALNLAGIGRGFIMRAEE